MQWLLNELSLEQRFNSEAEFLAFFSQFFKEAMPLIKQKRLFASRMLAEQVICAGKTFRQIIQQSNLRDIKQLVLIWLNKNGPFWTDEARQNNDNYFECNGVDVTEFAIGEATRRQIADESCAVFSLGNGVFDYSPLVVQHGLSEEILGRYDIENEWQVQRVVDHVSNAAPPPTNWRDALQQLRHKYQETLILPEYLLDDMIQHAFSIDDFSALAKRLGVLRDYLLCLDSQNEAQRKDILDKYFHGDKAWFTDESETDKKKFKHQLTFLNPETNKRQTYSFHGKINNNRRPKLRFYFKWPLPGTDHKETHPKETQQKIAIVYFGQKITKK